MIRTVLDLLATHGYIEAGETPQLNVLVSSGTSVTFEVFARRSRFLHVKTSELLPLRGEYESLVRARADYGRHVPQPLLHRALDGLDVMVTEGVRYAPLHARDVELGKHTVVSRLATFFETQTRLCRPSQTATHVARLQNVLTTPVARELADAFLPWLAGDPAALLTQLPHVPQHCDFTANNLGFAGGELVVFDWEDAGVSSLHGLDICTLLMSVAEFDRERFSRLLAAGPAEGRSVVRRLTAAAGIPYELFLELVPAYLLEWLALKASYSTRLQGQVRALLDSYLVR